MRSLFMSALGLAFAAPAYAQGFYGRADLHGNLTRCAANGGVQMWS